MRNTVERRTSMRAVRGALRRSVRGSVRGAVRGRTTGRPRRATVRLITVRTILSARQ